MSTQNAAPVVPGAAENRGMDPFLFQQLCAAEMEKNLGGSRPFLPLDSCMINLVCDSCVKQG